MAKLTPVVARSLRPWALLALIPLAACNVNPGDPMAATVPQPMPSVPSTSSQDQTFAVQAAGSDMFEIKSSEMALQKSRNPAIRRFAQRMIDDHTRTSQKLAGLAGQKGITLPTAPEPAMAQKMSVLDAANRTFDREYVADQISVHRDALQVNRSEASSGTDPDLKAAAQENVPMIEQHLAMARRLR